MKKYSSINIKKYKSLFEIKNNLNKDIWDFVKKYKNDKSIFITFTKKPKVSINLKTSYETPIGIYTYPLKEFIKKHVKIIDESKFLGDYAPFAGSSKYVHFLKLNNTSSILPDLHKNYTEEMYKKNLKKLKKKYNKLNKELIEYALLVSRESNPAGKLMSVLRSLTSEYTNSNNKRAKLWTEMLQYLGHDGLIDRSGKGYIYALEPIQAVFFNKSDLETLNTFENK